jgi:CelD/BcsL family acetyltransferase involved in cellulose biosynthesis
VRGRGLRLVERGAHEQVEVDASVLLVHLLVSGVGNEEFGWYRTDERRERVPARAAGRSITEEQPGVRATVVRPADLGEAELCCWRAFQASSLALQNPFVSPAFARAVDLVSDRARVAVFEDAGATVGFLAFELRAKRTGVPIGRKLSNRQAFVTDPHLPWTWPEVLEAAHLDVLAFGDLVGSQAGSRSLSAVDSPVIDTLDGWDAYLRRITASKTAKTTFYKERKLRRDQTDVRFETGPAKDLAQLRQLVGWKSAQYRRSGWPNLFARRGVVDLLDLLANSDAQEGLRAVASSLRVDGKLVATDLSLTSETVFAGWFGAHDPEYSRYSPGAIRTLRTIEAAFELGVETIDLARGDETYKHTLKTGDTTVATGYVARPSGRALTYQAGRFPMDKVRDYVLTHESVRGFVRDSLARVGAARESLAHRH